MLANEAAKSKFAIETQNILSTFANFTRFVNFHMNHIFFYPKKYQKDISVNIVNLVNIF